MCTTEDQPPPDELSSPTSKKIFQIVKKLTYKRELRNYVRSILSHPSAFVMDEIQESKKQLLLQGLDDNDIYFINEFLSIHFDGDLVKIGNRTTTKHRANLLNRQLS